MAHDVFISYSSKDKPTADATCAVLEQKGIRCWMAPRDILPGTEWSESIVDAIHSARAFVLLFSANANLSPQISREVERAVNKGLPVIPFRIENVMPVKSLEYFLSTPHWLDAFNPPLEQHLNYLADVLRHILDGKTVPEPPKPAPAPVAKLDKRTLMIGGGVLVAALAGWLLFGPSKPPSFVGNWKIDKVDVDESTPSPFGSFSITNFFKAAVAGKTITGSFDLSDLGQYKYSWGGEDKGTVARKGRENLVFTSDFTHSPVEYEFIAVSGQQMGQSAPALGGKTGDGALQLAGGGGSASMLIGNSTGVVGPLAPVIGHWFTDTPYFPMVGAIKTSLDITEDGRYDYKFTITETGMFQSTPDGKWTRTPQAGVPVTGSYKFHGSNEVTAATPQGTSTWKRVK